MTRESAQKHAALIRAFAAGHEIEFLCGEDWEKVPHPTFSENEYRIALPPGKSYNNPENFTDDQLGKDHRFCLLEELDGRLEGKAEAFSQKEKIWMCASYANVKELTYRVPIETLFPSEPPEPKTRPFTIDDITPNMVFRKKNHTHGFNSILSVNMDFVSLQKDHVGFERLFNDYLYSTDGKTFLPCSVNL